MGTKTKIQWADSTVNFWEGCAPVSAGCEHCYAARRDRRFHCGNHWGAGAPRLPHLRTALTAVEQLNRKPWVCKHGCFSTPGKCPEGCELHRRRVFVNSLGDPCDCEVPDSWRQEMWAALAENGQCNYLLLSKRPIIICKTPWTWNPPKYIWIGATAENQRTSDERIPRLSCVPAAVRWVSCEPLLERIDLTWCLTQPSPIQWVVIGAETGPGARPCKLEWVADLVAQCRASGVPCFVKQVRLGDGRLSHDPSEWPPEVRVREWPVEGGH